MRALLGFIEWFLQVSLDQVTFMATLFDLDALGTRLRGYVEARDGLRIEAARILDEILLRGEMARGDAERISGLKERTARALLGALVTDGILGSDTPKGPVSLRFPVHSVESLPPPVPSSLTSFVHSCNPAARKTVTRQRSMRPSCGQ